MRMVARLTHSVSGPAPSARARQPVIPPMRAAKNSGYLPRPGYLGWNLMPPSKRMTSAFM
jgi:hypothetical protein